MVPRLVVAAITAGRLLAYTYTYLLYSHQPHCALTRAALVVRNPDRRRGH